MTVIVGVKTNYGPEAIVMASDRQLTHFDQRENPIFRDRITKINVSERWMAGNAGNQGKNVDKFYRGMNEKPGLPVEIKRAIKKGNFPEFVEAVKKDAGSDYNGSDYTYPTMLMAANSGDGLQLCEVNVLGVVYSPDKFWRVEYGCVGSGKREAEEKIKAMLGNSEFGKKVGLERALILAYKAVQAAEVNTTCGMGLDIAILTKEGVSNLTRELDIRRELSTLTFLTEASKNPPPYIRTKS